MSAPLGQVMSEPQSVAHELLDTKTKSEMNDTITKELEEDRVDCHSELVSLNEKL